VGFEVAGLSDGFNLDEIAYGTLHACTPPAVKRQP
jgi:hypothetical protein